MSIYIVLLGPPGAGKGTQAKILARETGLVHVSSGDLFRENLSQQTELGKLAKSYMDRGELVPDEVTIQMIGERLNRSDCQAGAILDGFPRTPAQAKALDALLRERRAQVNLVPLITAPLEVLVDRLGGRWTCRAQGHVYHEKYNPPRQPGRCDVDGSELYQRDDDRSETVQRRIQVYFEQTAPLIDYYRQRGVLLEVDGTQPIETVTAILLKAIQTVRTAQL